MSARLRERIEAFARAQGTSVNAVVEAAFEEYAARYHGAEAATGEPGCIRAAFEQAGLIGSIQGPGDKSTNPKYFEGFGRD